nr:hypothetical protein [Tanacetum cinerariifolium]
MDSDKYLEGQSMKRPPLFESDHFIYWKNRFKTYVKAKDLDLWHIIMNGDFSPIAKNEVTQILEDNKIDLLVQQYEKFTILEEESIDSGFARFDIIITSLNAFDEGFSIKNYVRKFLRALHPKWRAKVTVTKESKDLSSLALDELIDNLKVHKVVMEKDSGIYIEKRKELSPWPWKLRKNLVKMKLQRPKGMAKNMLWPDEKKRKSDRKCFRCGDPSHLIGDSPKPPRNKDQKAFIRGSWSDSENDTEDKTNDETCLMAQSLNLSGNHDALPCNLTSPNQIPYSPTSPKPRIILAGKIGHSDWFKRVAEIRRNTNNFENYTKINEKEAQLMGNRDCLAGNPCEL